ncbi:MAG: ElyC/SanA/YdcF family protein [Anaerovoracaceae bacterium]|nr:ElyC/SanA/YdcF family protein [Anaerovoracaceae bacterium]
MILKILLIILAVLLIVNFYVVLSTMPDIVTDIKSEPAKYSSEEITELKNGSPECILVLGAAVKPDGQPSRMLKHRLDAAIELYKEGAAPKLLVSGDNGSADYNEVDCMYKYALAAGVPSEDIFLDHAGFSTYESVYRARDVFNVDSMIIVTQKYHLYRALYISDKLGVKAKGVGADQQYYKMQVYYSAREILARDKDVVKCIAKPEPTYLGDSFDISGSGEPTH